jgi:drug/metabolite transporter (DMT)-like permease
MKLKSKTVSIILLLAFATCLGSVFMFSVIALDGFSPMAVGSLRVIFASAFLLIILKVFGQSLVKSRSHWKFVTIYGTAFSTLPFLALPWALQFVSSSAAAISFASIPLWVLVLSRIFLKLPITPLKWVGFAIGSIGLIALANTGTNSIHTGSNFSGVLTVVPYLILLLAALGIAAGGVQLQTAPNIAPLSLITSAFLAGNIIAVPVLLMSLPKQWPPMTSVLSLLWIGIIATGLATVIRGILIKREGILFTSTNSYIVPVFASVLGASFLGEKLTIFHGFAYLMVVSGLLLSRK